MASLKKTNLSYKDLTVTGIKVYKIDKGESLKANVALTFNELLVVYVKLIEGKNGCFLSFPNHSYKDGKKTVYRDDVYSLDKDYTEALLEYVMNAYEAE